MLCQIQLCYRVLNHVLANLVWYTFDRCIEPEMLFHGHEIEDGIMLRTVANQLPSHLELSQHAVASDLNFTIRGRYVPRQALECGRLARAVHTKKSKAFSVV